MSTTFNSLIISVLLIYQNLTFFSSFVYQSTYAKIGSTWFFAPLFHPSSMCVLKWFYLFILCGGRGYFIVKSSNLNYRPWWGTQNFQYIPHEVFNNPRNVSPPHHWETWQNALKHLAKSQLSSLTTPSFDFIISRNSNELF